MVGVALVFIAFEYLVKTPAPGGAVPGCLGILTGIVIALGAIVKMLFF